MHCSHTRHFAAFPLDPSAQYGARLNALFHISTVNRCVRQGQRAEVLGTVLCVKPKRPGLILRKSHTNQMICLSFLLMSKDQWRSDRKIKLDVHALLLSFTCSCLPKRGNLCFYVELKQQM